MALRMWLPRWPLRPLPPLRALERVTRPTMSGFQIVETLTKSYTEAKSHTSPPSKTKCRGQSREIIHSFPATHDDEPRSLDSQLGTPAGQRTTGVAARETVASPSRAPAWSRIVVNIDNTTMKDVTEIAVRDSGRTDQGRLHGKQPKSVTERDRNGARA